MAGKGLIDVMTLIGLIIVIIVFTALFLIYITSFSSAKVDIDKGKGNTVSGSPFAMDQAILKFDRFDSYALIPYS